MRYDERKIVDVGSLPIVIEWGINRWAGKKGDWLFSIIVSYFGGVFSFRFGLFILAFIPE